MSADFALRVGRRTAEALMTSSCVITRTGERTLDHDTDLYVAGPPQTVYQGPCRVKSTMNRVSAREAEGQLRAAQQLELHLPIAGSDTVHVDDLVTISDGGADPALTGRRLRISGRFSQTYATARRLPVESLT